RQLLVRRGLRALVPRLPLLLRRARLRGARRGSGSEARARAVERPRRGRDRRSRGARRGRTDRRRAEPARLVPRAQLGASRARGRGVAGLLAPQARLPRRVPRPPREGRAPLGGLGGRKRRVRLRGTGRWPCAPRAGADAVVAGAAVPERRPLRGPPRAGGGTPPPRGRG